jgi:hypothetical protein
VRIGKRGFGLRIKGNPRIEFSDETLTTYAGLELFRRYARRIGLYDELLRSERRARTAGDFRLGACVLLVVAMLLIGARRLSHVGFLRDDPLVRRFSGLARLPSERTLGRTLARYGYRVWPELDRLCVHVMRAAVVPRCLSRVTLDVDGSVLTTGLHVERAERGFNPHHRKNPSYYPIIVTLAQTSHVVAHQNRRGNVHDSHRADRLLRTAVGRVREDLAVDGVIEVRADAAFFHRNFLRACDAQKLEYAVKVPMWPWLNLRSIVKAKADADWEWVDRAAAVQGVVAELPIPQWGRVERIAIYRKRVGHEPVKGRQLDLFNPDDGYWEYSVVATNKVLGLRALWHFANGRGAQEKTVAELKSGFAFDCIPTQRYAANTTWQKLNVLAHNLAVSFQLQTTPTPKSSTLKRTAAYVIRSIRTLRFEWLNKAARWIRPAGRPTLRLARNPSTERAITQLLEYLDQAA